MAVCWLTVFIVLLFLELCTVNLVSIWFAIGSFASFFVSFFTDNMILQMIVFIVVSVVTLLVTKPFVKKVKANKTMTNLDRVIGMEAVVTEDIFKFHVGEVKVDGKKWSAKSDDELTKGEVVLVEKIDGVKLIVKKKED